MSLAGEQGGPGDHHRGGQGDHSGHQVLQRIHPRDRHRAGSEVRGSTGRSERTAFSVKL